MYTHDKILRRIEHAKDDETSFVIYDQLLSNTLTVTLTANHVDEKNIYDELKQEEEH